MAAYLEKAEKIAREAHAGQLYGDRDYVEQHVAVVAGIICRLGYGEDYQSVGWLHDTIEDTGVTRESLLEDGMPLRVVTAVELLTKRPGVDHKNYLDTIATDPLAVVGKFADSSANFSSTMLLSPEQNASKFRTRTLTYAANIAFLQYLLPPPH